MFCSLHHKVLTIIGDGCALVPRIAVLAIWKTETTLVWGADARLAVAALAGAGVSVGGGERQRKPRAQSASGLTSIQRERPPTIKGVIAPITGRLRKWDNPHLGAVTTKVIGLPLVEIARLTSLNWSDS